MAAAPPLSLGISPCPNDVYIFSGILGGAVRDDKGLTFGPVHFEDVETLNRHARAGALDVVKISYATYPHIEQEYELLPCGGALGRGVGPLLLTGGARTAVDLSREILAPGAFTTANFLLDFYAHRTLGDDQPLTKRHLPFDILYDELRSDPEAQGVVIHEKRFTYAADGMSLVQDLGQFWEEETGYAIPLGAIAVRRRSGAADHVASLVRESLRWADTHRDAALALCQQHAQDFRDEVMEAHIRLYVNDYSHDLGDDGHAAVEYFLAQQRALLTGQTGQ